MQITNDIRYIGVNDFQVDLFEGQYRVPDGISYNSYVILDEKVAVMDTVDRRFGQEWLGNLAHVLQGRSPDYLIVQHMEPDHSANILKFMQAYPHAKVVATGRAFPMMAAFFQEEFKERRILISDGDTLNLGKHLLTFVLAPMVHWPEVMVTYDACDKILFSADGFGKFGVPKGSESNEAQDAWDNEARRYYIGIVGKYGAQVQRLLEKASKLDIQKICPLHGPVLSENLKHYLDLYNTWSSYSIEEDGIVVAYTSVYGHTKSAVESFVQMLKDHACPKVVLHDLARCDMSEAVSDAFKYSKLVLATTTYNADMFPFMRTFIDALTERAYKNRTVAFIENGSWSPLAMGAMKHCFASSHNIVFAKNNVTIHSALDEQSSAKLQDLATELCHEYELQKNIAESKQDLSALFKIGYGLYVVTSKLGETDNGCIVNTVTQVTNSPNRLAVTINKQNYSHEMIQKTGKLNVNCLSTDAPFQVFQRFGFHSGRDVNKFDGIKYLRTENGVTVLGNYINAFMSLKVEQYVDLGTHGMFICSLEEAQVLNNTPTMTYTYYQENVKPKPQKTESKGFVCTICGWVYEGDELPEDIICPLCKHGAADFEPL